MGSVTAKGSAIRLSNCSMQNDFLPAITTDLPVGKETVI